MKKLVYPALLLLGLVLTYFGNQYFENKGLVALGSYILFLIIVITIERLFPYKKEWNKDDGDTLHDLFWSFFGAFFPIKVIQAFFIFALAGAAGYFSDKLATGIWPTQIPFVFQVILCFVIAEFMGYWAHRLRHEVPILWRFHALHHSPHRLYFLNTSRFHPIDIMVGQLFIFPWMVVANVPAEVIFWNTILFQNIGLLSHCNIKFDNFKVVRLLFNTDEHHRWHHSKVVKESNSNYAPSFILWDIIWGTFHTTKNHEAPEKLGVTPEYPDNLWDQLLEPFRNEKWKDTFKKEEVTSEEVSTL
jgi:sterol desaturase/sphingolipid hydroxylase (fatty acid hydroxylase superfamily)